MTIAALRKTMATVEAALPLLVRSLLAMSDGERARYVDWRSDQREWHRRNPDAYARWLDGEIEPPAMPPTLAHLFRSAPVLVVGDDAGEAWQLFLEGQRA